MIFFNIPKIFEDFLAWQKLSRILPRDNEKNAGNNRSAFFRVYILSFISSAYLNACSISLKTLMISKSLRLYSGFTVRIADNQFSKPFF